MKKHIAMLLLTSLLLSTVLPGCSGDTQPSRDTTAPTVETKAPEAETTAAPTAADILGFDKEDNGGETFTILTNSTSAYEFNVESQTGDIVSDAVFKKDRLVEEYLGIDIELVQEPGLWAKRAEFNAKITQAHSSGDNTYDLINNMLVCTIPLAQQGMFVNVVDLPHTNYDQPWYIKNMVENYGINGKFYGIISDHSLSLYKDLSVIFFNSTIWSEQKPDVNLYDLVRKGEWTLDKFIELTSDMTRDLNGDTAYDTDNDLYTYFTESVPAGTWMTALDIDVIDLNDDGTYTYHGLTERFESSFTKLLEYFRNVPGVKVHDSNSKTPGQFPPRENFAEGRVAMMSNHIYATEYIRDMTDDYGIIPIPKFDQAQDNYISQVGTSTSTFFVPQTQMNLDLVSKFIECEAYFGYTEVSPVYYETALKTKYADDPNMQEMLDIIRENATIDFMFVYGNSLSGSPHTRYRFGNLETAGIAVYMATYEKKYLASIDKLLAVYAELG